MTTAKVVTSRRLVLCVYVYIFLMCRDAHTGGNQKAVTNVIPQVLSTLLTEAGSLTWRSLIMAGFLLFHTLVSQLQTLMFGPEKGFAIL